MSIYVDKYVEVSIDAADLTEDQVRELVEAKFGVGSGEAIDSGVTPEQAYYAMHRGDMETVRRFVCGAAGRIA